MQYQNVVICKRIKKTRQNATPCVAEWPKSARQVVLASWSVCGGVHAILVFPGWKSEFQCENPIRALSCADAQYTKIAIFCSKRIEVRASLLPGKKWSHVIINFKPQKIFQIYHLRKYFRSFFLANLTWIWFSWKIHSMLFDFHSIIQNGKARSQS